MARESSQKFVGRNRPPRVQLEYDVEVYGAEKKVAVPFVMGGMSDLSGTNGSELPPVADRKPLDISSENFDSRLKAMRPRINCKVANKLSSEGGEMRVDLTFESMNEFSPAEVAKKIEPLNKLLEARTHLANLVTYMDGKTGAEDLIAKILNDPALLKALAEKGK